MKQNSQLETGLKVGDHVRLIAETLAWRAEAALQNKIGEVIERRDDGRVTIVLALLEIQSGRSGAVSFWPCWPRHSSRTSGLRRRMQCFDIS
jgi:hypothetical protein